jgi:hypothetical protein
MEDPLGDLRGYVKTRACTTLPVSSTVNRRHKQSGGLAWIANLKALRRCRDRDGLAMTLGLPKGITPA